MGKLNKIIYFDRETISNILEILDNGNKKESKINKSEAVIGMETEISTKLDL